MDCYNAHDKNIEWSKYYKTLRICNVQQINRFRNKLVSYIVNHKKTNFNKHISLLGNQNIMNP